MRRLAPLVVLLLLPAAAPAFAQAPAGVAQAPVTAQGPVAGTSGTGGATYAPPAAKHKKKRRRPKRRARRHRGPALSAFNLGGPRLYLFGSPVTVSFRIDARAPLVDVRAYVIPAGARTPAATLRLGARPRGVAQTVALTGREAGLLPDGTYTVRVAAKDARGRRMRRRAGIARTLPLRVSGHRFPVAGSFSFGGTGARFGASRKGHTHQGQDIAAAGGTPVVAPRGGLVEAVEYQASGAGHYVVLDGAEEDRDYVFMHLRAGSIPVRAGQTVRTGQRIGEVGNTGRSFGAHLHFEVWTGKGWYAGGAPVDPLPYLRAWLR